MKTAGQPFEYCSQEDPTTQIYSTEPWNASRNHLCDQNLSTISELNDNDAAGDHFWINFSTPTNFMTVFSVAKQPYHTMDIIVGNVSPHSDPSNSNCANNVSSDGVYKCPAVAVTWLFCVRVNSGTTDMTFREFFLWSFLDRGPQFSLITPKTGTVSEPVANLVGETPISQTAETLIFNITPNVLFFEFPSTFNLAWLVATNFGSTDPTSTYDIFYG